MSYLLFCILFLLIKSTIVLTPDSADWKVFKQDYATYYLKAGNYKNQGKLLIVGKSNFSIIGDSSELRQVELIRCNNVTISGITFSGGTTFIRQCNNVQLRNSYLWQFKGASIRVIDSDSVTISNNHIETNDLPANDAVVGILTQGVSRWNEYLNNTIVNYIDGIGLGESKRAVNNFEGTIIEGNNIYSDSRVREFINGQEFALTENAIDIKNASLNSEAPVIIRNNKLHGHRWSRKGPASGSGGEEIVIHRYAKNIVIELNEIYDGVGGVRVGPTFVDGKWFYPNKRNVVIRGNSFSEIFKRDSLSKGVIYYIASETIIEGNNEKSYTQLLYNAHVKTVIK